MYLLYYFCNIIIFTDIIIEKNFFFFLNGLAFKVSDNLSDVKTEDNRSSVLSSDINESVHAEDFESDDDNEARSSQKSLPHKKRIPSKLKKALTSDPPRNIHAKCYKCTKCGEQFPTQATFNVIN